MRRAALAAGLLCYATSGAEAHNVIPGTSGFTGGLLHPLLVPSHVLALIALGLLIGAFRRRTQFALLGAFVIASLASFALIAMAYSATRAETLILCLAAVTGLMLAANLALSAPFCAALAAFMAAAILFDSVPSVLTVRETALSLAGTVLSAVVILAATAGISAALPPSVKTIAVRIAGSWIAASAVMVLALRLSA